MNDCTTVQTPEKPAVSSSRSSVSISSDCWLAFAALIALWIQLAWVLRYSWSGQSSYNYGWIVPSLTGLLLYARFRDTLFAAPLEHARRRALSLTVVFASLVAFAFARVLVEVNPFWRLPLWIGAVSLVAATLITLHVAAGRELAGRCAFPLLFALTMVPWPTSLETVIINSLTELVTFVSVGSLLLLGHPAERLGNVIHVGNLDIGVEEACSGIKSLQGLGMMALFIGAFWRVKIMGRLALIAWAIGLTLVFNFARSLSLALIAITSGEEAFDEWHDTVGYLAFACGLATLLLVASRLKSEPAKRVEGLRKLTLGMTRRVAIPMAIFACIPFYATAIWYRNEPASQSDKIDWTVDTRAITSSELSVKELPIHDRVREILGFDYGYHLAVIDSAHGIGGELWYYGYTGESKSMSVAAFGHTPAICMTASGARLIEEAGTLNIDLGSLELPFRHFVFEMPNGRASHVFWCLWDDVRGGDTAQLVGNARLMQLESVFRRQSSFKRKVALIGIPTSDESLARSEVTRIVRELFLLKQNGKTFRFR